MCSEKSVSHISGTPPILPASIINIVKAHPWEGGGGGGGGGSLADQTLFPVWGCGRKCGGEKGSGLSGPYSVASAGM